MGYVLNQGRPSGRRPPPTEALRPGGRTPAGFEPAPCPTWGAPGVSFCLPRVTHTQGTRRPPRPRHAARATDDDVISMEARAYAPLRASSRGHAANRPKRRRRMARGFPSSVCMRSPLRSWPQGRRAPAAGSKQKRPPSLPRAGAEEPNKIGTLRAHTAARGARLSLLGHHAAGEAPKQVQRDLRRVDHRLPTPDRGVFVLYM